MTRRADARPRLADARGFLAEAHLALTDAAEAMPHPERLAALELRADVAEALRRLNALEPFTRGTPS